MFDSSDIYFFKVEFQYLAFFFLKTIRIRSNYIQFFYYNVEIKS